MLRLIVVGGHHYGEDAVHVVGLLTEERLAEASDLVGQGVVLGLKNTLLGHDDHRREEHDEHGRRGERHDAPTEEAEVARVREVALAEVDRAAASAEARAGGDGDRLGRVRPRLPALVGEPVMGVGEGVEGDDIDAEQGR